MTWSYTSTDPGGSNKDLVRLLSGDIDTTDQLIQDEEITALLTLEGDVRGTAAAVLEHLAAKFARKADKEVGDLRIWYSQRSAMFAKRAAELREKENEYTVGAPKVGGISKDRKDTVEDDSDRVRPAFIKGQLSNPRAFGRAEDLDEDEQP